MATVPDWIREAAEEIERRNVEERDEAEGGWATANWLDDGEVAEIIAKHCPMQEGVAYMPVPRCETCRHWADGKCNPLSAENGYLTVETRFDFGCVEWEAR